MKQINLLPPSVRQQAATRRALPFFAVAVVAGLASVAVIWVSLRTETTLTQSRIDAFTAFQKKQAATDAKKQEEARKAVDPDLIARVQQLNTLSATETDWSALFGASGRLIPQDIRLASMSLAPDQGTVKISLGGQAPSNLSFAVFLESLRANKALAGVGVSSYAFTPSSGVVQFSLGVTLPASQVAYPTPSPTPKPTT